MESLEDPATSQRRRPSRNEKKKDSAKENKGNTSEYLPDQEREKKSSWNLICNARKAISKVKGGRSPRGEKKNLRQSARKKEVNTKTGREFRKKVS